MPTFTNTRFETTRRVTADLTAPEPMRFPALDETLAVEAITVSIRMPADRPACWSAYGTKSSDAGRARIDFDAGQEDHCPPRLLTLIAELIKADQPARAAGHLHSGQHAPRQSARNGPDPS